jgi:hypothetical protein
MTEYDVEPDAALNALVAQFVACTLPREAWTHQAHLAVGLWHVRRYGAATAQPRLRDGIRRLNDSHGTANSATSGYHETVTRALVALLSQFNERCPSEASFAARLACVAGSTLADQRVLLNFYSRETLNSTTARMRWIEPDLAPLEIDRALR